MADYDKTPIEQRIREAIVKGIVEKKDPRAYLGGSGIRLFLEDAINAGLIDNQFRLTDAGKKLYSERACHRPKCRWNFWD